MRPRDDPRDRHRDVVADLFGDQLVVAGKNLDRDARPGERFNGLRRGVLGRIEKRDVAEQGQLGFIGNGEDLLGAIELAIGDGQHPVAVGTEAAILVHQVVADELDQRIDVLVDLVVLADRRHLLHRAFADEHMAVLVVDDHGHAPALEVEGDLVDLPAIALHIEIAVGKDGAVEEVAQARLVKAVHVGVTQHVLAAAVGHVHIPLQHDVILRERAGLVRAKHVHRAEILDGVQVFHDDLLPGHEQRALREADGDDHRQHLGREADGDREGKEQGLAPVVLCQPDDEERD